MRRIKISNPVPRIECEVSNIPRKDVENVERTLGNLRGVTAAGKRGATTRYVHINPKETSYEQLSNLMSPMVRELGLLGKASYRLSREMWMVEVKLKPALTSPTREQRQAELEGWQDVVSFRWNDKGDVAFITVNQPPTSFLTSRISTSLAT